MRNIIVCCNCVCAPVSVRVCVSADLAISANGENNKCEFAGCAADHRQASPQGIIYFGR